jgi:hypothetical protein
MDNKKIALPEDGKDQKADDFELTDDKWVEAVRASLPYLKRIKPGSVAKFVKERWDRMDKQARAVQNELRVNWLRYNGDPFAQVHPTDQNRIFTPNSAKTRLPPSINDIKRTVHRYMAQVTADEPIMEGAPAAHTDEARDAAESATKALQGEWARMNLNRKLQRVNEVNAVMRSGFWFFEWDATSGGKTKLQKFFPDPVTGRKVLHYVDSSGNKTDDPENAAEGWEGNLTCDVLFPMNVRWSGGDSLRTADEVFVGKVITLGQLYEMHPKAKEVKIKLLAGHVTREHEEWFHEIRGAGGIAGRNRAMSDEDLNTTGSQITEVSSLLDEPVMLINYYRKPSRDYPKGFHAMTAGEYTVYRGNLKYGVAPVAQFKCLDDLQDPLGFSLVDLLKDPQELKDFVNGQVLRFLQSMKRRWFVPLTSGVNTSDLLNPTRSVIHYNSNSSPPTPEQVPEIPKTLIDWVDRFDASFNDQAGIHDTMKGKHVPGVSSGRHAEALRSGDETILGLTRTMIQEGLEDAGEIMLAMIQKEWKTERKVRFFGGRQYVEAAFSNTDFGDTKKVYLKRGTLLMLTQAQKLETLFSYVEMQAISQQELRKLAPLVDTAGISVTEDPHYIKARREGDIFLKGPSSKLKKARTAYERGMEILEEDVQFATKVAAAGGENEVQAAQQVVEQVQVRSTVLESEWTKALAKHAFTVEAWEQVPLISSIHFEEHSADLASDRLGHLPEWWIQMYTDHTTEHLAATMPPPEEEEIAAQDPAQQMMAG